MGSESGGDCVCRSFMDFLKVEVGDIIVRGLFFFFFFLESICTRVRDQSTY